MKKLLSLIAGLLLGVVTCHEPAQAQNYDHLCNLGSMTGTVTLDGRSCAGRGLSSGLYRHFKGTLTGNVTLGVQNLLAGLYVLEMTQDGTGGRVVTFGAIFEDEPTSLTTTAGTVTRLMMWWNGTNIVVLSTDWAGGVGGSGVTATVFNVKDYGATGDGTTDDTDAIVAAFAAAGNNSVVYFPAGTYSTLFQDLTTKTGLTIRGQGPTSVLKRRPGGTQTEPILRVQSSTDIVIEYLGIDLNNCLSFCSGIEVRDVTRFRVQYNRIFDSNINTTNTNDKFGITAQGSSLDEPGYIMFNVLEDVQLEMDRLSNILIQGNKVIRPRFTAGIGFFTNIGVPSTSRNVQIVNNIIQDADVSCAAICIILDPPDQDDFTYTDFLISGNTILYTTDSDGTLRNGIQVGTGNTATGTSGNTFRNFQIINNHIWAHPTGYTPDEFAGISLAGGPNPAFVFDRFTIAGNTISLPNALSFGMLLRMTEHLVLRNNSIYNMVHASGAGIAIIRTKHAKVYENEVWGAGGIGMSFVVVNAYDEDVRSWKNVASEATLPFKVDDVPSGQYSIEDFPFNAESTQQVAAVTDTVRTWAGVVGVDLAAAGAPLTMTSTPTLVAGREGQRVTIVNVSTHTLTLQDERSVAGTKLYLRAATVAVPELASISFRYIPSLVAWVQE